VATRTLGIIMNGVTGRMGLNQHLVRSILAIRDQGGVALPNGDRVMPDPILVGRNAEKIAALGKQYGVARTTTDLAAALKNPNDTVFFDAATTQMRADLVTPASTFTAKSRSRISSTRRSRLRSSPSKRASRTAWCRTSCSSRASARSPCCAMPDSSAAC